MPHGIRFAGIEARDEYMYIQGAADDEDSWAMVRDLHYHAVA